LEGLPAASEAVMVNTYPTLRIGTGVLQSYPGGDEVTTIEVTPMLSVTVYMGHRLEMLAVRRPGDVGMAGGVGTDPEQDMFGGRLSYTVTVNAHGMALLPTRSVAV